MTAILGSAAPPGLFAEQVALLQAGYAIFGPSLTVPICDIAERAISPTPAQADLLRRLREHAALEAEAAHLGAPPTRPPLDPRAQADLFTRTVGWLDGSVRLLGPLPTVRVLIALQPAAQAVLTGLQVDCLRSWRRVLWATDTGDLGRAADEARKVADLVALVELDEQLEAGR